MKRAFAILLLMLTLALWGGAVRAADAGGRGLVEPAPINIGDKLGLYSYLSLGVEVRSFTDEEFREFRSKLDPYPKGRKYSIVRGKPAALALPHKTGLIITRVVPGSPAEKAGISVGDVICDKVTPADLLCSMRNSSPGIPMHMWLIDTNLRWKYAMPRPEARPEAAAVGHIIPRKLCAKHRRELRQHQARAIELLAMNPVPIPEACTHLESIARILYRGYTPGCLRIPLRSGDCSITATRNGYDIHVSMTEAGVETRGVIRRWVITVPENGQPARVDDGPATLPEAIRQRLLEIDTTGAEHATRYDPNSVGRPIDDCCSDEESSS